MSTSTAFAEEKIAGVVTFLEAATVEVRGWKSAYFCDKEAMVKIIQNCEVKAQDVKDAGSQLSADMSPLVTKASDALVALRRELPGSEGVFCRSEWAMLHGCVAQLSLRLITLKAQLRQYQR